MKKMKLLVPLVSAGSLLAATSSVMASCSCHTQASHIEAAEKDIQIVGNDIYGFMTFTLNEDIGDKIIKAEVDEPAAIFTFGEPTVTNKLVKLPVVWKGDQIEEDKTVTWDITFTCTDSSNTEYWKQTIKNCSATYKPTIYLNTQKSPRANLTNVITSSNTVITGTYYLNLNEALEDERLTLKPWFYDVTSTWKIDETNTKIEINPDNKKEAILTLVVQKQDSSEIAVGDKFDFTLQVECLYQQKYTYWQSVKMTNMSLAYDQTEFDIDVSAFETELVTEGHPENGYILKSINWDAVNTNANTLFIPAKKDTTKLDKWIRKIGDFTSYTEDPLELRAHEITKIKFGGIGVQEVAANAFKGCNTIKYIDLSGIDDDVKSLEKLLTFGTDSFAGFQQVGTIIWHADISKYKQSIFKYKFYGAGLTAPAWFGFVSVSTEEQLREYARVGGNIQLQNNITIDVDTTTYTGEVEFYANSIVDLNGYTITANAPIYNSEKAEFALIGIWDCEVLFTDSSDGKTEASRCHNGCVKAYDNSAITQTKYPDPGESDQYWEWYGYKTDSKGEYPYWKPRESRCFYVRSDIPSKSQGTLEISAGRYYGNCTVAFNYNTTIYIDDIYSEQEKTSTYKGEYAPEFHLLSPCFSVPRETIPETGITYTTADAEMLNCLESTYASGYATFQCWGGKFFGKKNSNGEYHYFNPAESTCDYQTLGRANWTTIRWVDEEGVVHKTPIADSVTDVIGTGDSSYRMVVPLIEE